MKKRLIALLFCTIWIHVIVSAQTIPSLPEMSFAKIVDTSKFQGDRWSFMEAGSPNAPAIVMLHGIGGSSVDWRFQLSELSDSYHAIAWNAPGYMLSDGLKAEKPSRKDYADALADFLNALKLDKVYLVGNSFGTAVAQCFAYYYPERVIKMVFLGAIAGINSPQQVIEQQWKMRKAQVADGGYSFSSKRVEALLAPNPSPELVELVRKGMRGVHPKEFLRTFNFMTNILASNEFLPTIVATKVTMPVLLISGSADAITPIALHADPLHKALPNSRLEILQNIGHLPHLEAPEKVNKLIRDFLGLTETKPKYDNKFNLNFYQFSVFKTLDSLIQFQEKMILAKDTVAMKAFYPEDMVITNPFGQMIDKNTTIKRVKSGIISYSKFEKTIEHFAMESDKTAILIGKESVTPTNDANRTDAGKPHERRFTEVWVLRNGNWQRLIRHASNP